MKKLVSIVVSLLILALIYWKIDVQGLVRVFQDSDRFYMMVSLGMVIPLTMLTAWRLQQLVPSHTRLDFTEANRLILAASVLNMILPSKMGDIAKAYFMRDRGQLSGSLALSIVIFEKACDLLSLLLWCVLGLMLYPQKGVLFWLLTISISIGLVLGVLLLGSRRFAQFFFFAGQLVAPKPVKTKLGRLQLSWREMHDYFWCDRAQLLTIVFTSIIIWFLHLLQIWFFILALKAWVPFVASLALSPLAILAGLLPLTFAGVGTRDAALILFYHPFFGAPTAAALGVLCTSRYLLPAIGGLPLLGHYLTTVRQQKRQAKTIV